MTTFFSLPLELRLHIYRCILTNKFQLRPFEKPPSEATTGLSFLKTCKKIYVEASPLLYSENTFLLSCPNKIMSWFTQIGPVNVAHLKRIRISVSSIYCNEPKNFHDVFFATDTSGKSRSWCKMIDRISDEATRLACVYVFWEGEESCVHYGVWKNLSLVLGLAKVQGLKRIVVEDPYPDFQLESIAEKTGIVPQSIADKAGLHQILKDYLR